MYFDDILFQWESPEMSPFVQKPAVKVACFPSNGRPAPAVLICESFLCAEEAGPIEPWLKRGQESKN